MTDKEIIIDGLSCDNCPEIQRYQEQQIQINSCRDKRDCRKTS